ncbi:MAG: glycosyltransferase [Candidatus Thorarchaeota archaeon]
MVDPPLISVIIPFHSTNHKLPQIRKALSSATASIQSILVLSNPELAKNISPENSSELVVVAPRKGRGFAFLEGIANVTGTITMLLHSDTIPPHGWDQAILAAMKDTNVVGGGFSLAYALLKPHLELGNWILNQWFRISGELYGDRAMFIRSHILRRCLQVLEVPLFEDLRLTQCMHNYGRVVLLKEKVETSPASFRKIGLLRYIGNFWLCRFWYALGGSPFQIYDAYYPTKKSE